MVKIVSTDPLGVSEGEGINTRLNEMLNKMSNSQRLPSSFYETFENIVTLVHEDHTGVARETLATAEFTAGVSDFFYTLAGNDTALNKVGSILLRPYTRGQIITTAARRLKETPTSDLTFRDLLTWAYSKEGGLQNQQVLIKAILSNETAPRDVIEEISLCRDLDYNTKRTLMYRDNTGLEDQIFLNAIGNSANLASAFLHYNKTRPISGDTMMQITKIIENSKDQYLPQNIASHRDTPPEVVDHLTQLNNSEVDKALANREDLTILQRVRLVSATRSQIAVEMVMNRIRREAHRAEDSSILTDFLDACDEKALAKALTYLGHSPLEAPINLFYLEHPKAAVRKKIAKNIPVTEDNIEIFQKLFADKSAMVREAVVYSVAERIDSVWRQSKRAFIYNAETFANCLEAYETNNPKLISLYQEIVAGSDTKTRTALAVKLLTTQHYYTSVTGEETCNPVIDIFVTAPEPKIRRILASHHRYVPQGEALQALLTDPHLPVREAMMDRAKNSYLTRNQLLRKTNLRIVEVLIGDENETLAAEAGLYFVKLMTS